MTLADALNQYANGSKDSADDGKKTGHFHNLAEILAGVDSDPGASKTRRTNRSTMPGMP